MNPFRGVLIVGGPGSGKSASIINPIISQAMEKKFTGIIYYWKYPELSNLPATMLLPEPTENKRLNLPLPTQVPTDEDIKANYAQIKRDVQIMGKVYLDNYEQMS